MDHVEAVRSPPVDFPTALRWVPGREALVVGTRDGRIVRLDPALDTCTPVAEGLGEIGALDVHVDRRRYLCASRDGSMVIGTLEGERLHRLPHPFRGEMQALLLDDHALVVGDVLDLRVLLVVVLGTGATTQRLAVPPGVVPIVGPAGRPMLCRSTPSGFGVIPLWAGTGEASTHRLRTCGRHVLGFDAGGVFVRTEAGGGSRAIRLPEVTAGDVSHDGRWVGLGTARGAVTVVPYEGIGTRRRPTLVRAFRDAVTSVALADRGRWLATGAENLRIWSFTDGQ